MAVKSLRKFAELNLCENCYGKYVALLEPTIKSWLLNPLNDWRWVESYITRLVMKLEGVFKDDWIFISVDEDSNEKFADKIDVKAFKKIKKWGFKSKIKYLHDKGILQDSSYKFLCKASDVRNRIHDILDEFLEQDLAIFSSANAITSQIYNATMLNFPKEMAANIKSNAEKVAEQLLLKIDG